MQEFIANLTWIGHVFFAIFIVLAPFLSDNIDTLALHSQLVLFMMLKWAIREWECGFTMMEYRLRGCKKEDTFLHSILGPVVDVYDYDYHRYIIPFTLLLGIISYYRGEMLLRANFDTI